MIPEVRSLRTCDKCGKANEPTRKFCIRCGTSLIKPEKPRTPSASAKAAVPDTRRATIGSREPSSAGSGEASPPATQDRFIRPSEVSKDRVRTAGSSKHKSELDKAREAFAKAESVGIDEADGSGIVETRMLRASEVRELLEGPGAMAGSEEVPAPRMMEGSEPLPPEAEGMMTTSAPTSSQLEESILGSKSAFVDKQGRGTKHLSSDTPQEQSRVSPSLSADFSSSRYEPEGEKSQNVEDVEEIAWSSPEEPAASAKPSKQVVDEAVDLVITCPDCGKTISVDMFEYPREVYSAMAAARMKQARFFIVQGKGDEALRVVKIAYALYNKAGDKVGIQEIRKLIDTLAKRV